MEGVQDYNDGNILVMHLLENSNINSLWLSSSPPSFHETIVNFDQERHQGRRASITKRDYNYENDDNDDNQDAYQPEKKRRLSARQVKLLEKSFTMENKLEFDRKLELAKELGLQPRQVAIWFQNRRARYKTKHLEKEYASLKASYDQLKLDFDALSKETHHLQHEVKMLTKMYDSKSIKPEMEIEKVDKTRLMVEEASSTKSDIVDSESPHWIDRNHLSLMEDPTVQRPDISPEDEGEDDLMMCKRVLLPSMNCLVKVEDSTWNFSSLVDEQPFWSTLC